MILFLGRVIIDVIILMCFDLYRSHQSCIIKEEVCFAATKEIDDIKLYLNEGGYWGEFSIRDTILFKTAREINVSADVGIEKIGVSTRFIQEFK